jgi:hypothetical protein
MLGQGNAINQVSHDISGPLAGFFHDLFNGQRHVF